MSIESVTLERLRDALHELGFRASVVGDAPGVSFVRSASNGMAFDVRLGSPAPAGAGEALDFRMVAAVQVEGAIDPALPNAWNNDRRFSRLHLDHGMLLLDMDVSVAGGVSPAFLTAQIETWNRLLTDWVDQMRRGFPAQPAAADPEASEQRLQATA